MKTYFRGGLFKEVTVDMMFLPDLVSVFQFQLFPIAPYIHGSTKF